MKKLSLEALNVLENELEIDGHEVRIRRTLDRKLYVEVNTALEALGGKWNRKAKSHLFDETPADALEQVLVDGGFHDKRRDLQQFFTPPELAREVVERAEVRGCSVLEPSAGAGALAKEAIRQGARLVHAVDIDYGFASALPVALASVAAQVGAETSGQKSGCCGIITDHDDFVLHVFDTPFERVVMNPPFTRQQDVSHVMRAWGLLAPGGVLVAIMAAGARFRMNARTVAFRDLVMTCGEMEPLSDGSFSASGTDVSTVLVTLKKGR